MAAEKILIVDDEPGVRDALCGILGDEGFVVGTAATGEEGIERCGSEVFDAVLLDVWLPGVDGLETLRRIRELQPDVEVIMISGHGTIETAVRATKLGAFDFVEKPLSLDRTLLVLRNALRQRRLEHLNRRLVAQLSRDTEIVGDSPVAERLRYEIEQAAAVLAPVLLVGRPGTGRSATARRIHVASAVGEGPFVDILCAVVDASTMLKSLTDTDGRRGRFALASGGSLFLDEVDRLDPAAQLALADALTPKVDGAGSVRLFASTGSVRLVPELAQRLDVLRIVLPNLSERSADVPVLAARFMRDLAAEYGRSPRRLTPELVAALCRYKWPGNVRELRNLVERWLLLSTKEELDLSDLPTEFDDARPHPSDAPP